VQFMEKGSIQQAM